MRLPTKTKIALIKGTISRLKKDFTTSICFALEDEAIALGKKAFSNLRYDQMCELIGIPKPLNAGSLFWFPRNESGQRKRLAILRRRLKQLCNE